MKFKKLSIIVISFLFSFSLIAEEIKLDDNKNSSSCSSTKVECVGDTIYFCAPVNKTSVLELSKIIKKKNDDLERIKRRDELIDEIVPKPLFLRITSYGGGLISARSAIDAIMSSKIPIHTDHGSYTMHAKINITWGPEEGVIQWWKSDKTFRKKLDGYGEMTSECHDNLWANEEDCELLYEANTNKPSLVNVGMLHGTNNPTPLGRWTLCFVPVNQRGQFLHWNDALETFKNYLEN